MLITAQTAFLTAFRWILHLSGAAGVVLILIIFPAIVHKNCRRIYANKEQLWEDEREMLKWGMFYSGFKCEYWWFFGACHVIHGVFLAIVSVVLSMYPVVNSALTTVVLALYCAALIWLRPYDAWLDLAIDLVLSTVD